MRLGSSNVCRGRDRFGEAPLLRRQALERARLALVLHPRVICTVQNIQRKEK